MATTTEIMKGISQIMSSSYDGALDASGDPISAGLKREEGNPLVDSRVIDGFSVRMTATDKLCILYHVEMKIKDVHANDFESDIESAISSVKSFVQKEFKKHTGESLSLKEEGNTKVDVEYISRVRTSVRACQIYKVSGLPSSEQSSYKLDDSIKKWLDLKSDKRPQNDKR